MVNHTLEKMRADGASEAEVAAAREEWDGFAEMYKNPIIRFCITLIEPTPPGILLTLISAALLRRKDFLPAEPQNANA